MPTLKIKIVLSFWSELQIMALSFMLLGGLPYVIGQKNF